MNNKRDNKVMIYLKMINERENKENDILKE